MATSINILLNLNYKTDISDKDFINVVNSVLDSIYKYKYWYMINSMFQKHPNEFEKLKKFYSELNSEDFYSKFKNYINKASKIGRFETFSIEKNEKGETKVIKKQITIPEEAIIAYNNFVFPFLLI